MKVPVLKPGMTIRIHQKIQEGEKVRTQVFEGLVVKVSSGSGVNKTFTVRKVVDGIGVEKIFPFYAPSIEKIELTKRGKVRRAKLYYMRDLQGKSTRLKDLPLGELEWIEGTVEEVQEEEAQPEEATAEEAAPAENPEVTEEVEPKSEREPIEETPSEDAQEEEKKAE